VENVDMRGKQGKDSEKKIHKNTVLEALVYRKVTAAPQHLKVERFKLFSSSRFPFDILLAFVSSKEALEIGCARLTSCGISFHKKNNCTKSTLLHFRLLNNPKKRPSLFPRS